MATVTGITAAHMLQIEEASIVAARIENDNLILTTHGGVDLNVGNVRGVAGAEASAQNISDAVSLVALSKANNLSDLVDVPNARTSLGLGGASLLAVGTTAGTVAAGNDSRFGTGGAGILSVSMVTETAIGVWSGDAPVRIPGQYPIIFSGTSDPADPVNGINTPANINATDTWLRSF